uniref:Uncharacterized protein n=1 Tax=Triticum urartu TaxID=4572 RepID=A0A8R7QDA5_TRIUA
EEPFDYVRCLLHGLVLLPCGISVVGEMTSTPPSTGAGVWEYCHNSYNGCFSKVE